MGVKCSPSSKKDGNIRFCVDYRKLNSLTQKDDYPCLKSIPAIDILSGAVCFSTLDLCFTGSKYTPWRQPNYLHVPLGNLPFPAWHLDYAVPPRPSRDWWTPYLWGWTSTFVWHSWTICLRTAATSLVRHMILMSNSQSSSWSIAWDWIGWKS